MQITWSVTGLHCSIVSVKWIWKAWWQSCHMESTSLLRSTVRGLRFATKPTRSGKDAKSYSNVNDTKSLSQVGIVATWHARRLNMHDQNRSFEISAELATLLAEQTNFHKKVSPTSA